MYYVIIYLNSLNIYQFILVNKLSLFNAAFVIVVDDRVWLVRISKYSGTNKENNLIRRMHSNWGRGTSF